MNGDRLPCWPEATVTSELERFCPDVVVTDPLPAVILDVADQLTLEIEIGAPLLPVKFELAPRILRFQVFPFFALLTVTVAASVVFAGVTVCDDGLPAANVTPPDVDKLTVGVLPAAMIQTCGERTCGLV